MNWTLFIFIVVFLIIVVAMITTIVFCCKGDQCKNPRSIKFSKKEKSEEKSEEKINKIELINYEPKEQSKEIFKNTPFENNSLRLPDTIPVAKKEEMDKGITLELNDDVVVQSNNENGLVFDIVQGNKDMYCNQSIDCEKEGYYMIHGDIQVSANSIGEREGIIVVKNNHVLLEQGFEVVPEKKSSISFTSTFYKSNQDQSGLTLIVKNNSDQDFILKKGSRIQCIQL